MTIKNYCFSVVFYTTLIYCIQCENTSSPSSKVIKGHYPRVVQGSHLHESWAPGETYTTHNLRTTDTYPQFVRCSRCLCAYINDSYYIARCTMRTLADLPETLPHAITHLCVSNTSLKILNTSKLLVYRNLAHVSITFNFQLKLISAGNITLNETSQIFDVDLSNNGIQNVEENSFNSMMSLRQLNLSSNFISKIHTLNFFRAINLQSLDLSLNALTSIDNDSFDALENLKSLYISGNKGLTCSRQTINPRLFKHLKKLENLDFHKSRIDLSSHLCKAILELNNLRTLHSDAYDKELFDPDMKNLTFFSSLYFDGFCFISYIRENFFENTPYLRTVEIKNCPLYGIDIKAFRQLPLLTSWTLDSSFGNYSLESGLLDLEGLQNSSLKHLALRYLHYDKYVFLVLKAEHARYLRVLSIETLDLSGNNIAVLEKTFTELLPNTLQKLILNNNHFYYDHIFINFLWPLKNLVSIEMNNEGYFNLNSQPGKSESCYDAKGRGSSIQREQEISTVTREMAKSKGLKIDTLHVGQIKLPPNLTTLYGNNNALFAGLILCQFIISESLTTIIFPKSFFPDWKKCNIPSSVKIADLSDSFSYRISNLFLPVNSSLEYLDIHNNFLGPVLTTDTAHIFDHQKNLVFLDISRNLISHFPPQYFKGLTSLEILKAAANNLDFLNTSFEGLNKLRYIDFSTNSIRGLSKITRQELDQIATLHPVFLDLSENPLPCMCSGLELFIWMSTTNVVLINELFLKCQTENGITKRIFNLQETVNDLRKQCTSKSTIIIICISCLVFLFVLTIVSLAYKYRWRLRYFKSVALMKLLASKNYVQLPDIYKFDAYILYEEETRDFVLNECIRELEVKRGHRLCIEDRDFLPGTYIVTNIVSAIQNSAVTLVIITPDFYLGQYSEYGIKMSIMTEIFEKRSILNLLILEPTAEEDLSHDILAVLKSNRFTEYPPRHEANDEMIEQFWNQISQIIAKTQRV